MTTERRLERDLPSILGELAMGPYPDYIDDVLATTAQRRQRPAWTYPERWLPMFEVARQPVLTPSLPWRQIGVLTLIALTLVAALAAFVGSQPRLPEPFGHAANGLVAYEAGGDIYTADPSTGVATAIVSGPETDSGPNFSRDGSHIVFARMLDTGRAQLYVARSNGRDLTLVTPEPLPLTPSLGGEAWEKYEFSPDGRSVLIATSKLGFPTISIAQSDGSGVRGFDVGMAAYEPSFRPPDGEEILFVGNDGFGGGAHAIFAANTSTGVVRLIVRSAAGFDLAGARWSPDGSLINYTTWDANADSLTSRTHVISADGTGDRELRMPEEAVWQADAEWSNDGTRLFLRRGYTKDFEDVRPVVIPADGTSVGVEIRYPGEMNAACCSAWEWSPDDSAILGTPTDVLGRPMQQVTIDPRTGVTRPTAWSSTSEPTWQRVAP